MRVARTVPGLPRPGWIGSQVAAVQLRQSVDIDRQQQRMKQQNRCKLPEIAVGDEGHVACDRDPTQAVHRAHAECREHEAGGAEAYSVDDRQVAHPISFLLGGNLREGRHVSPHRRSRLIFSDPGASDLGLARQ